jgi:hypothetical protein
MRPWRAPVRLAIVASCPVVTQDTPSYTCSMTFRNQTVTVVAMLLLVVTGCSSQQDNAKPQTAPVDQGSPPIGEAEPGVPTTAPAGGPARAIGEPFTLAWKAIGDSGEPEDRNVTITVTMFACGDQASAYVKRGVAKYKEDYGQASDAKVDAGYMPCAAVLRVANTAKKKAQFSPTVKALDSTDVEYDQDDGLTELVALDVTRHSRETFGSNTVGLNPRETGTTATAYQIPKDTKITRLRYVIADTTDVVPLTALIQVG